MDLIGELPPEVGTIILKLLPPKDLWNCMAVCKYWRLLSNSNSLWNGHILEFYFDPDVDEECHCKYVECAKGELI